MKNLTQFHRHLLGVDPSKTPPEYLVTPVQRRLYDAEGASHGYLLPTPTLKNWERFLSTFVLAYSQATEGPVVFAASPAVEKWTADQMKIVARHIFGVRKGVAKKDLMVLFGAFKNLSLGSRVLQMRDEPARWVAYGYRRKDVVPPWMRGKLLSGRS